MRVLLTLVPILFAFLCITAEVEPLRHNFRNRENGLINSKIPLRSRSRGHHALRGKRSVGPPPKAPRIAIIGSGLAGASAAYFLQTDPIPHGLINAKITVFDKESKKKAVGPSKMIHPHDRYLNQFRKTLALKKEFPVVKDDVTRIYARNILKEDGGVDKAKVLELGTEVLDDLLGVKQLNDHFQEGMDNLYKKQVNKHAIYETVPELVQAMGPTLWNASQMSAKELFHRSNITHRLVLMSLTKLAKSKLHHNLKNLNGLLGYFLAMDSATTPYSVEGGNSFIAERLIKKSGSTVALRDVAKIAWEAKREKFRLSFTDSLEDDDEIYDIVIVASRLDDGSIQLDKSLDPEQMDLPPILSKKCVELFRHHRNLNRRRRNSLMTDPTPKPRARPRPTPDPDCKRYHRILQTAKGIHFRLHPKGLYYIAASEPAVPSLEMSVISARNVAFLVNKQLSDKSKKSLTEG